MRATSKIGASGLTIPESGGTRTLDFYVAAPHIDTDALPTTTIAVPISGDDPGWIVAEISLEELWRAVDSIKVGTRGYALLMDQQAKLLAHGNPNDKGLIASNDSAAFDQQKLADALRQTPPPDRIEDVLERAR